MSGNVRNVIYILWYSLEYSFGRQDPYEITILFVILLIVIPYLFVIKNFDFGNLILTNNKF